MNDHETNRFALSDSVKQGRIDDIKARFESALPQTRRRPASRISLRRNPMALTAIVVAVVMALTATLGWLAS